MNCPCREKRKKKAGTFGNRLTLTAGMMECEAAEAGKFKNLKVCA